MVSWMHFRIHTYTSHHWTLSYLFAHTYQVQVRCTNCCGSALWFYGIIETAWEDFPLSLNYHSIDIQWNHVKSTHVRLEIIQCHCLHHVLQRTCLSIIQIFTPVPNKCIDKTYQNDSPSNRACEIIIPTIKATLRYNVKQDKTNSKKDEILIIPSMAFWYILQVYCITSSMNHFLEEFSRPRFLTKFHGDLPTAHGKISCGPWLRYATAAWRTAPKKASGSGAMSLASWQRREFTWFHQQTCWNMMKYWDLTLI